MSRSWNSAAPPQDVTDSPQEDRSDSTQTRVDEDMLEGIIEDAQREQSNERTVAAALSEGGSR